MEKSSTLTAITLAVFLFFGAVLTSHAGDEWSAEETKSVCGEFGLSGQCSAERVSDLQMQVSDQLSRKSARDHLVRDYRAGDCYVVHDEDANESCIDVTIYVKKASRPVGREKLSLSDTLKPESVSDALSSEARSSDQVPLLRDSSGPRESTENAAI